MVKNIRKTLLFIFIGSLATHNSWSSYIILKKVPCGDTICSEALDANDSNRDTLYDILIRNQWPTSLAFPPLPPEEANLHEKDRIKKELKKRQLDGLYEFVWLPDTLYELYLAGFLLKNKSQFILINGIPYNYRPFFEEQKKDPKNFSTSLTEIYNENNDATSIKARAHLWFSKANTLSQPAYIAANQSLFHDLQKELKLDLIQSSQAVIETALKDSKQRRHLRATFSKEFSNQYIQSPELSWFHAVRPLPEDQDENTSSILDGAIDLEIDAYKKNEALLFRGTNGVAIEKQFNPNSPAAPVSQPYALDSARWLEDHFFNEQGKLMPEIQKRESTRYFQGLVLDRKLELINQERQKNGLAPLKGYEYFKDPEKYHQQYKKLLNPEVIKKIEDSILLVRIQEEKDLFSKLKNRIVNDIESRFPNFTDSQILQIRFPISILKEDLGYQNFSPERRQSFDQALSLFLNSRRDSMNPHPTEDDLFITPSDFIKEVLRIEASSPGSFDPAHEAGLGTATLSFGASLFAGLFQDSKDQKGAKPACAYSYFKNSKLGYAVRIPKRDYYLNYKGIRDIFYIPPIDSVGRLFESGEFFHPRTRSGVKGFRDQAIVIRGIGPAGGKSLEYLRKIDFAIDESKTSHEASAQLTQYLADHSQIISIDSKPVSPDDLTVKKFIQSQNDLARFEASLNDSEKKYLAIEEKKTAIRTQISQEIKAGKRDKLYPSGKTIESKRLVDPEYALKFSDSGRIYDNTNPFSKILRKEAPSVAIYEDPHVFAFQDIRPKTKVHSLIIPKGSYTNFSDLMNRGSPHEIVGWIRSISKVAESQKVDQTGYRFVSNQDGPNGNNANQEVKHLHGHIFGGECLGRSVIAAGKDPAFHKETPDLSDKGSALLLGTEFVEIDGKRYIMVCQQISGHPKNRSQYADLPIKNLSFTIFTENHQYAFQSIHDFSKDAPDLLIEKFLRFVRKSTSDQGLHSHGYRIIANHGNDTHKGTFQDLLYVVGGELLGPTATNVFGTNKDYGYLDPKSGTLHKNTQDPVPHLHCDDPLIQNFISENKSLEEIRELVRCRTHTESQVPSSVQILHQDLGEVFQKSKDPKTE